MAVNITKELKESIKELYLSGMSNTQIAKEYGISRSTVIYNTRDLVVGIDPIEKQKRKSRELAERHEHVEAVRELAFRRFIENAIEQNVKPIRPVAGRPKKKSPRAHQRHPLLVLTDLHFEETVKEEGVLGLNSYDVATAMRRVWRVIHAALDWKRDFEAGGRFKAPDLTVALLGDMLTGTLHGLERHSDAPNVVRAALACGDLLALALRDLAGAFKSVKVVGVVGNHGRLPDDRKVPTKDPTRSWDFMVYQIAKRRLDAQKNISWHLPDAYGTLFDVAGHQCYAAHGNFIPNNLGVVGYGIRRFTSALASNLSATGNPLKYAFFGHWHAANASEFSGVEAFICPSLIGTQEYSFLSGGSVNRGAQELHLFDEELGWVGKERIYGEGPGYEGTYEVEL